MRLAIFTDVHANLPALQAALDAIDALDCDTIIHTGDAIAIGPYPVECVKLLIERDVTCLMGNHDAWYAFGLPDPRPTWMSEGEVAHQRWTHAQLGTDLRYVVATWPYTRMMTLSGLRIRFVHYALQAGGEWFAPYVRPADAVTFDRLFNGDDACLVFFGHDHAPIDLDGTRRYLNPGSLGCSNEALARFAVLDVADDGTYTIQAHAVPYDDSALCAAFTDRQVPEREMICRSFYGGRFSPE